MSIRDRAAWPAGPWDDEPDRAEWRDPATNMPCLARRGPLGAWCGYVAVPPDHPLHGTDYDAVGAEVHGGLTYAGLCDGAEGEGICHVPAPGESGDVWWFGFDCAHGWDVIPGMPRLLAVDRDSVYRSLEYVKGEVASLASQLASAGVLGSGQTREHD